MDQNHIETLVAGFKRFREGHFLRERELFQRLAQEGQSPRTLIVGCCDSRVDPAIIMDADPGELFVIRNVANLVPPFETGGNYHGTSAALEFGVRDLKVENIIVLGHAQCGGIRALMRGTTPDTGGFISGWMQVAAHARNRVQSRLHGEPQEKMDRACEREAVLVSLDNLLTFPWILERVAQRKLALHGWYFDIEQGELQHFNPASNRFEPFV